MRSSFRAFTVSKQRGGSLGIVGGGMGITQIHSYWGESLAQESVQEEVIVGGVLQKWDGIDFTARRVSVRREISILLTQEGKWYK